ncbi:MAG: hypothetical protein V2A54_08745 [Bacteroidota bacterium]
MRIKIFFLISVIWIPQYCLSQDTAKIKKQQNHLSVSSYIGLRYVDQEIPMAFAGGLGVTFQIKKHVFSFRTHTRLLEINMSYNLMRVNTWLAPDETIREYALLYRLYQNKKKTISFDAGVSYIDGFNHGNFVMVHPNLYDVEYNRKKFHDVGIPIELRFLLIEGKRSKMTVSSASNLNFEKSFTSLNLLLQIHFGKNEK